MLSAVLTSAMEAAVTRSEDNELRRMMRRIKCSGGDPEPIGRRGQSCSSVGWEQDLPAPKQFICLTPSLGRGVVGSCSRSDWSGKVTAQRMLAARTQRRTWDQCRRTENMCRVLSSPIFFSNWRLPYPETIHISAKRVLFLEGKNKF